MNPLLSEVISLWNKAEPTVPFSDLINDCMVNGCVVVKPGMILIAKELWTDGKTVQDNKPSNCWFIFAASQKNLSNMHFMKEAIWKKEYVAFCRRGKLHIYPWEYIERKLQ
jgi:hypothetical protein